MAERRIENFLPFYRTARQWRKSRPVVLELPLFPTYVFVRIARQARGTVLGTPGVLSIVDSSREPWPLPDFEIEALRLGIHERKIEPHPYLTVGERVRIKAGVMTGVEGILVRKKADFRVVVTLDTIMRSVAVEWTRTISSRLTRLPRELPVERGEEVARTAGHEMASRSGEHKE